MKTVEECNQLVLDNYHFARYFVSTMRRLSPAIRRLEVDECLSEALYGMTLASRRFDPDQGTKFVTYASYWMRKRLYYAVAKGQVVNLPYAAYGQGPLTLRSGLDLKILWTDSGFLEIDADDEREWLVRLITSDDLTELQRDVLASFLRQETSQQIAKRRRSGRAAVTETYRRAIRALKQRCVRE